jgi:hypothetical protein
LRLETPKGDLIMAANDPKRAGASGAQLVTVSNWQACYNSGDGVLVLSCTVTTRDSSAGISGAGLILNNSAGATLGTSYTEFAGSESVNLALNLQPSGTGVGDSVMGVVTGEVQGQHYFIEQQLTVGSC